MNTRVYSRKIKIPKNNRNVVANGLGHKNVHYSTFIVRCTAYRLIQYSFEVNISLMVPNVTLLLSAGNIFATLLA